MEIKKSDVTALESKLESFSDSLPEQEKNVLSWILARAKANPEVELTEADLESASGGVADASGFEEAPDSSIEVTTKWSR